MDRASQSSVNNDIYHQLGERWYTAKDDAVALLRAESRSYQQWIARKIHQTFRQSNAKVLDIGCGAGFLSNELAREGFEVSGIDLSENSLLVAKRHDTTCTVTYQPGDAYALPYLNESFEVICAMDLLEHAKEPAQVINEIARLLKPQGLFFFHTFNRNLLAWLMIIKGVEWLVRNTPKNLHVLSLFIKPDELRALCKQKGLVIEMMQGLVPKLNLAFWHLLASGEIADTFEFKFSKSLLTGYLGYAKKKAVRPTKLRGSEVEQSLWQSL